VEDEPLVALDVHGALRAAGAGLIGRVPFGLYTGYANADLVKAWPQARVLRKPARDRDIIACIVDLTS